MKKQFFTGLLLMVFVFTMSGCSLEDLSRKFVRKNKKGTAAPTIYHVEPFTKPSNEQIYSHAFLFWRVQEEQLLNALSPRVYPYEANILKVRYCLGQAISNLDTMKKCLNQTKAEELGSYISELTRYDALLNDQALYGGALSRMRADIETHKRNVDIRFCVSAVKNDFAPEPVSEPEPPAANENTETTATDGAQK